MFSPSFPPQPLPVLAHAFQQGLERIEGRIAPALGFYFHRAPLPVRDFRRHLGQNCLAKRDRSNTPLQALTLLNADALELARAGLRGSAKKDPVLRSSDVSLPAPERGGSPGSPVYLDQQIERLEKGELRQLVP